MSEIAQTAGGAASGKAIHHGVPAEREVRRERDGVGHDAREPFGELRPQGVGVGCAHEADAGTAHLVGNGSFKERLGH